MLLLIIFVVVVVVCGLILHYGPLEIDCDLPGLLLGIVMLVSGVAAFICLCFLIGAKVPAFERAERIKREEQYAHAWKRKYDALLKEGFSVEQAWEMTMKSFEMY